MGFISLILLGGLFQTAGAKGYLQNRFVALRFQTLRVKRGCCSRC